MHHRFHLILLAAVALASCQDRGPTIPDVSLQRVVSTLTTRPDFVGVGLLDDGHLMVVAVHGPANGVEEVIRAALPAGGRYELRHVPHALAELNQLRDKIGDAELSGPNRDRNITLVDVDELNGFVVIGVQVIDDGIVAALTAKYGDVKVQQANGGTRL